MKFCQKVFVPLLFLASTFSITSIGSAEDEGSKKSNTDNVSAVSGTTKKPATTTSTTTKPKVPAHTTILKGYKSIPGLIPLYQKETKLLGEITSTNLNKDFIVLISIARGISQQPLLGGFSWGFGDDWVWQFRKVGKRMYIVRRNVRFRAKKGTPEEKAVKLAYTDSVLFSLPIITKGPKGGDIIDLTSVFMSDLPQISQVLRGFAFSSSKSTWAAVKGYADNIELQVAATYASSGTRTIETVPDTRGVTINVHYSISKLKKTGYVSRYADDRVGYFLTVVKDYSRKDQYNRYARYINRWNLQKADSTLSHSPPKKPIIFWIEKTVPLKFRKDVRDGILEWNKAYEKIGYYDAIEVRQQPDNATWDPEDINYNTFRWITASAGFAMGPSRVNPLTGEILDADIIFDADFMNHWKREFETWTPASISKLLDPTASNKNKKNPFLRHDPHCRCTLHNGFSHQMAFGSAVLATRPNTVAEMDKLLHQALKEVVMHEVGHTLGLRHNFKASTLYNLKEMNDKSKTSKTGLTASVMDYAPTNMVPKKWKQGDYYSTTIGPYDYWAIEYGYKPQKGGTEGEIKELKKIASRSGEKGLAYLTDEDTSSTQPDPLSNRFDYGDDLLEYAKMRTELIKELWPGLVKRVTKEGEGYQKARRAFNILIGSQGRVMSFVARNVGGVYVSRSHRGDKGATKPFVVVDAKKQRASMTLLEKEIFSDKPFSFPSELYNQLAASRWSHWGTTLSSRTDFPVHSTILNWQNQILGQLLSSSTLTRLYDSELKVPANQDAFTTAELIERLTNSIFSEVVKFKKGKYTTRKPAISSLRRNLQRAYLKRLSNLALGRTAAPADCQAIAIKQLRTLLGNLEKLAKDKTAGLDAYTQAHVDEAILSINKVLKSRLQVTSP